MARVPPQVSRLLGGKFTSLEEVLGWRHFEVVELARRDDAWCARLAATCESTCTTWVRASALLKQEGWRAGWIPLRELSKVTPRPSP